jgi:hypothetical protein
LAALLLTASVYLRGWLVVWRQVSDLPVERTRQVGNVPPHPRHWHSGQLAAILGGLSAI